MHVDVKKSSATRAGKETHAKIVNPPNWTVRSTIGNVSVIVIVNFT